MKIKSGDNVKVISGRKESKGKTGKVIQVLDQMVVIDGVNLRKKHLRSGKQGEKGQVIELPAPIHISNVMLVDPKTNAPTRVGFKMDGENKKRIAKKTGEYID